MRVIVLLLLVSVATTTPQKLPVQVGRFTTVSFPEEIVDLSLGSADYAAQIKGRYLLLKAKRATAKRTSLFVRYGAQKRGYTAVVSVSQKAPLLVEGVPASQKEVQAPQQEVLFTTEQDYYHIGTRSHGLQIMVTHILQKGKVTYIRLHLKNSHAVPFYLSKLSFEYLIRTGRWRKKYQRKEVKASIPVAAMVLPAHGAQYVLCKVPAHSSDGLQIRLQEQKSGRSYTVTIPEKTINGARKK